MDEKLRYGLMLLSAGVCLALILEIKVITNMGRVIATPFNLMMFYITLFFAFVIFFGSIGLIIGILLGVLVQRTRII